jgi:hypothetical protein
MGSGSRDGARQTCENRGVDPPLASRRVVDNAPDTLLGLEGMGETDLGTTPVHAQV